MLSKKEKEVIFEKSYNSVMKNYDGQRASRELMEVVSRKVSQKVSSAYLREIRKRTNEATKTFRQSINSLVGDYSDAVDFSPSNVIFSRKDTHSQIFVVEEKPQIRTVEVIYSPDFASSYRNKYRVAFPYSVFFVHVKKHGNCYEYEIHYFFRNKPLKSMDDMLYVATLPNIYPNGKVCMGDDAGYVDEYDVGKKFFKELNNEDVLQMAIREFYGTTFEGGISEWNGRLVSIPRQVSTWEKWDELSKNPIEILKVDWTKEKSFKSMFSFLDANTSKKVKGIAGVKKAVDSFLQDVGI